jgi:AcrR family transcriptional regulator
MRAQKPVATAAKPPVPARDRIVEAADRVFEFAGIRAATIPVIAHLAKTSSATVAKYFALEDLIFNYLARLAKDDEENWRDIKNEFPGRAAQQLRDWIELEQIKATTRPVVGCPLSNVSVELILKRDHPAREVVKKQKKVRLDHIARLCREAGYRDPELLASKLNLLVEGAYISSLTIGAEGPANLLVKAAEDLVACHGGKLPQTPKLNEVCNE